MLKRSPMYTLDDDRLTGLSIGHVSSPLCTSLWAHQRKSNAVALLFVLWAVTQLTLGCTASPPVFIEVNAPEFSADAIGPYMLTVKMSTSTSEVRLMWRRATPIASMGIDEFEMDDSSGASSAGEVSLRLNGETWSGGITSTDQVRHPIADYAFWLEARNDSGRARYPSTGVLILKVRALSGRCVVDRDCLSHEICHRSDGYCFIPPERCDEDAHCPRDQFCNLSTTLCRFIDSACAIDTDCPVGLTCADHRCIPPCGGACAEGFDCIEERCVQPTCLSGDDCPPELPECIEGVCEARIDPPPIDLCDPECLPTEWCLEGRCGPRPACLDQPCPQGLICAEDVCVDCTADGQCGAGQACQLSTMTCVPGRRGRPCVPCGSMEEEWGSSCGVDFTCVDGATGCRPRCELDDQCGTDEQCISEGCVAQNDELLCRGGSCSQDVQCESGECIHGYCTHTQRCGVDEDCVDDLRCVEGICRVEEAQVRCGSIDGVQTPCPSDALCVSGRCEPSLTPPPPSCATCVGDLDCQPFQFCEYFERVESRSCYTLCRADQPDACPPSFECVVIDSSYSVCLPEQMFSCDPPPERCGLDDYEPNDEPVNTSPELDVLNVDAQICEDDLDWFHMRLGSYRYELSTSGPTGLGFFDEEFNEIDFVDGGWDGDEYLSGSVEGSMWVSILGFSPQSIPYTLSLTPLSTPLTCEGEDRLEENDAQEDAYPIGSGAELSLTLCPQDPDWFKVNAREGDLWTFTFESPFFPSADYRFSIGAEDDLTIYDSFDRLFTVEYQATEAGPLYFLVDCPECLVEERYTLNVSVSR